MKIRMNTKSYIISVSYGTGCYRHIRISGKSTLEELSNAILEAFEFDNDHLHAFFMSNRAWENEGCYSSHYADDGCPDTNNCRLQFVGLEVGKKFLYIFDFGNEWHFQCKVLQVLDEDTKAPEIVRKKGEPPVQYPEYDDEDEYYDDDEYIDSANGYFDDDDYESDEPKELFVPVPDELYDTAIRFKKTKLWNKLFDTDIFAVKLSNGETGYCSIMGKYGEYHALGLYIGESGLLSFYHLNATLNEDSREAEFERMLSQDCLQVCFENKDELRLADLNSVMDYAERNGVNFRGAYSYPFVLRAKPYCMPWYVTDAKEYGLLIEAIEAAIFVSEKLKGTQPEKLGFTGELEIPYIVPKDGGYDWQTLKRPLEMLEKTPSPELDEKAVSKLKGLKKLNKWECRVAHIRTPVHAVPEEAPYFPAMLIAVECRNDRILPLRPVENYNDNAERVLSDFADALSEYGRLPKTIAVAERRTHNLLSHFCEALGIELKMVPSLSKADEILEQINDDANSDEMQQMSEIIDVLEKLPDEELRTMPPEVRMAVMQMLEDDVFEPELEAKLRRALITK